MFNGFWETKKLQAPKKCLIYFDSEVPFPFPSYAINVYKTDKSDNT